MVDKYVALNLGLLIGGALTGRTWAPQVIYLEDEHSTKLFVVNNFGDAHDRQ